MTRYENFENISFTAAALALCGACDDSDDKVDPSTTEDKISISPTEGVVGSKGGDVSTMVTSSGEWTLEGAENAYVTPSAAKGKDGDIVAFTVKANDKEEDQVFTYTFACGKKTAPFKITLKKKGLRDRGAARTLLCRGIEHHTPRRRQGDGAGYQLGRVDARRRVRFS